MRSVLTLMKFGLLPLGMGLLLLMHLLVARTLTPIDFGLFSLLLTVTSISGLLISGGIPLTAQKCVSAFLSVNDNAGFNKYMSYQFLWIIAVVVLLLVSFPFISYFIQFAEFEIPVFIVPLLVLSVCVWLLQRNVCLGAGYQAWAIFPRDILAPLGTIFFVLIYRDVNVIEILAVFSLLSISTCLVVLAVVAFQLGKKTRLAFELPTYALAKSWFSSARAFLLSGILQLGMNGWDIVILGFYAGLADTGKYALAMRIASVVLILVRIANTFAGNKFANLHALGLHAENQKLFSSICRLSMIGALGIVMIFLISMPYWSELFGVEFADAAWIVVVLLATNAVIACFGPSLAYLNMTGLEQVASKQVLIWSLVSIVGNLALIPFIGVQGALISYVLSNLGLRLRLYKLLSDNRTA